MEIVFVITIGVMNIICFFIGAKVGQTVVRGDEIRAPNPVRAVKEYQENKEYEEEREKVNIEMSNIDIYDGTGMGQRDVGR